MTGVRYIILFAIGEIVLSILCFALPIQAQRLDTMAVINELRQHQYDRAFLRGDSLLASAYGRITYDTLFIRRPPGRWAIKFRTNFSGDEFETKGNRQGVPFHGKVSTHAHATVSATVSYRGLSVGLALNPSKLAGKDKDNELSIISYGNKFGFDASYLSSKSYSGHTRSGDVRIPIAKGMVNQKVMDFNAYYAFNGRRFSMPAAFTQSYQQLRSAGSVLVGMSMDAIKTDIVPQEAINYGRVKWKVFDLGIGAGYGYNLVVKRHRTPHWLFHLSTLPTFDIILRSHVSSDGLRQNLSYHFPCVIFTSRGAIVYSWKNMYVGSSMIFNYSATGDPDRLHITRNRWRLHLSYGFRF